LTTAKIQILLIWIELTGCKIPVRLVMDSMGVLKSITKTTLPTEKRLRIDLAQIRQGLRSREFVATWVPSRSNLADAFTKELQHEQERLRLNECMKRPLLDALRSNYTNLVGVQQVTKTQGDLSKY
jgi:hypothetical protein